MYDLKALEFDKVLNLITPFCLTNYAKEKIINTIPSDNLEEVKKLIDLTNEAINILVKYGNISINHYHEVLSYLELANKGSTLEIEEILDVNNLIMTSLDINKYLSKILEENNYPNIKEYNDIFINLAKLRNLLSLAISQEGKVLDQASKNLFQIRRKLSLCENKLKQSLNLVMQKEINKLNAPLIVLRDERMCLPVKIEYKNSFKGILHDISSSNNTCYIEPIESFEIANELDLLKEEEKVEIRKILAELTLLIKANYDSLINNFNIITELDVIFSKANYSKEYNKPLLAKDYSFNLVNISHPLIPKDKVVPISIKMTKNDNVIVITGPNTGGKTVTLKTVGLVHLMIQSGIYPASYKDNSYYVFKNILADIGDEQSIEENLSTFSSHITKIKGILENDLKDSLVLIDEVGSGTDPKEGSALAISIIDYLNKNGAKSIITTHYTDLKNYAYKTNGVINASVEFNINTLKPTYKILLGVPGQSNALVIANNLGLNSAIIDNASDILANQKESAEIINLEERINELNQRESELDLKETELNDLSNSLTKEKAYLESERQKILIKAKKDADNLIAKAKEDAANLLKEIKDIKQDIDVKEHVLAELKNKTTNLASGDVDIKVFKEKINVGDTVKIISYNQIGKVIAINKNKYKVTFNQFTMDFKEDDLIKTVIKDNKPKEKPRLSGYNRISGASLRLDLRGKRYEEVKDLLDDFIDKAVLANYESVTVVHGFGTGTVRQRVHELLSHNPSVKSFRFGGEGEGLNGATVVFLK